MAPVKAWAAFAALSLVSTVQAWHVELPPCLDNFQPFVNSGCYANTDGKSMPYRSSTSSREMTVEKCTAECKGNGYRYAGLEYYGICYCGNTVNGAELAAGDCNFPCNGDKNETCGGDRKLSVFEDRTFPATDAVTIENYVDTGCWTDHSQIGKSLSWPQDQLDKSVMTPSLCTEACRQGGFPYAGVEYGQECWCGAVMGNETRSVDASQCGMACKGDKTKTSLLLFLCRLDFYHLTFFHLDDCRLFDLLHRFFLVVFFFFFFFFFFFLFLFLLLLFFFRLLHLFFLLLLLHLFFFFLLLLFLFLLHDHFFFFLLLLHDHYCLLHHLLHNSSLRHGDSHLLHHLLFFFFLLIFFLFLLLHNSSLRHGASHLLLHHLDPGTSPAYDHLCTTVVVTTPKHEYCCGNWCSTPIPDFNNWDTCAKAKAKCGLQVAACMNQAGWPGAIQCFNFQQWCQNIDMFCGWMCRPGWDWSCSKNSYLNFYKPIGGDSKPVTSTSTFPCTATTTTTMPPATTTAVVPPPKGICIQPSNPWWGYGPGNPVGKIPLPVVTCNDLEHEFKGGNPFKLYSNSESSKCRSYKRPNVPSACADACRHQYDSCNAVYAKGCWSFKSWRNRREIGASDEAPVSAALADRSPNLDAVIDKRTFGQFFGDNFWDATNKCKAQYDDCINVNRGVTGAGVCWSFGTWW
ncbi:Putative C-5 sterol desaturase [Verticillium dahliae VDG2]|nr:Putative C-5 sterol desaturase [Verticillium dahliae VDG2]